jgi:hypothetical protein
MESLVNRFTDSEVKKMLHAWPQDVVIQLGDGSIEIHDGELYRKHRNIGAAIFMLFCLVLAIVTILLMASGCGRSGMESDQHIYNDTTTPDALEQFEASPALNCKPGYIEVRYTQKEWIYCRPAADNTSWSWDDYPCTGTVVWWGRDGEVRCENNGG